MRRKRSKYFHEKKGIQIFSNLSLQLARPSQRAVMLTQSPLLQVNSESGGDRDSQLGPDLSRLVYTGLLI